jgi:T5orf172 domain-containing protein
MLKQLEMRGHTEKRCPLCCTRGGRLPSLYLMARNYGTPAVCTKIGISVRPCRRLCAINKDAERLERASLHFVSIGMPDAEALETELQALFAHARMFDGHSITEWFSVSPETVLSVLPQAYAACVQRGAWL